MLAENYHCFVFSVPCKEGFADVQLFIKASNIYKLKMRLIPDPLNQIVSYVWVAITVKFQMYAVYVYRCIPQLLQQLQKKM